MTLALITPDWPLRDKVNAFTTTRTGGVSQPPYDNLNLALHVEDNRHDVLLNRQRLQETMSGDIQIKWLKQVHGHQVVNAANIEADIVEADAAFTVENNIACAVLTADCLPILLSDKHAQCIAAVHAGWRGVINGVIQNTVDKMSEYASPEYAWLGPAIGPEVFEVGQDVYEAYMQHELSFSDCFKPKKVYEGNSANIKPGKWNLNIYQAAKVVLRAADILDVFGGEYCTYSDIDQFFSFRRQARTGRMATIISKR